MAIENSEDMQLSTHGAVSRGACSGTAVRPIGTSTSHFRGLADSAYCPTCKNDQPPKLTPQPTENNAYLVLG